VRAPGRTAFLLLFLAAGLAASPRASAQGADAARDGFRVEGSSYVSVASARGPSARDAEEKARGAALHGLFAGLGADPLFAEVFAASPPVGLSFKTLDASREGFSFKASVRLELDDESFRIVQRGPYLAAALGILDRAEAASDEADELMAGAASAESEGDLGVALGRYGMAVDACRGALDLVDPVADPSIFSSKGKRSAPELKRGLASVLADAQAGLERIRQAESALAADESSASAREVADAAIAAAADAQALLDEISPLVGDLGVLGEERLIPLRDRISARRRSLADSRAALERAQASLAQGPTFAAKGPTFAAKGPSFASDQLAFAARRLDTAELSLASAYRRVDREIRDPAVRRAARAQAIRWAFLHEPREYLYVRAYLPYKFEIGEKEAEEGSFDAAAGLEGAFPLGKGGVWVRTQASLASVDLEPEDADGEERSLSQSFDFGVWGKGLCFAGYTWDWLRRVDGSSLRKPGAVRLGLGGVYEREYSGERYSRADWLLSLSWQLPYSMPEFQLWNVLNAGLDAQFRLGGIALLEASLSKRLDELPDLASDARFASVLRWSIAVGLRLPPPFALGAEYSGAYVQAMDAEGELGEAVGFDGGRFRFFLQYSI
jgi:hypothetical protein